MYTVIFYLCSSFTDTPFPGGKPTFVNKYLIIYRIISYPIHNLAVQEVVQVGGGYFSYYQTALRHKPQDHNINYFRIRSNPDPRFQNASVQVCETLGPRPS